MEKYVRIVLAVLLLIIAIVLIHFDLKITDTYNQSSGKTQALFEFAMWEKLIVRYWLLLPVCLSIFGASRNIYIAGFGWRDVFLLSTALVIFLLIAVTPLWKWLV